MKIEIYGNRHQERFKDNIKSLLSQLIEDNNQLFVHPRFLNYLNELIPDMGMELSPIKVAADADLAICLGGDGTFLRTAQYIGNRNVPILGINTGHLGFLAEVNIDDAKGMIDDFAAGCFEIEKRSMIMASGDAIDDSVLWPYALNEVAILKEDTASMITVNALINGNHLATYLADGLIVSTPTGSTGYNLSVGGPIIEPTAPNWAITPVAAHSLTMRPLVVSDLSLLKLTTDSRSGKYRLSLDGRSVALPSGSEISLQRAPFTISVVKPIGHSFADTLRKKLLWAQPLYS